MLSRQQAGRDPGRRRGLAFLVQRRNRSRFARANPVDSANQLLDDLAVDVGQPEVAAGVAVGELLVVEAQQMEDRGVQVVDVDLVLDGLEAELVGGAMDVAALARRRRPSTS